MSAPQAYGSPGWTNTRDYPPVAAVEDLPPAPNLQASTKELIIAGKITVVALTALALLAGAGFVGFTAVPLLSATGWLGLGVGLDLLVAEKFCMGLALLGAAIGLGLSGFAALWVALENQMHESTSGNLKDCGLFLLESVGIGLGGGAVGAILLPMLAAGCGILAAFTIMLCRGLTILFHAFSGVDPTLGILILLLLGCFILAAAVH